MSLSKLTTQRACGVAMEMGNILTAIEHAYAELSARLSKEQLGTYKKLQAHLEKLNLFERLKSLGLSSDITRPLKQRCTLLTNCLNPIPCFARDRQGRVAPRAVQIIIASFLDDYTLIINKATLREALKCQLQVVQKIGLYEIGKIQKMLHLQQGDFSLLRGSVRLQELLLSEEVIDDSLISRILDNVPFPENLTCFTIGRKVTLAALRTIAERCPQIASLKMYPVRSTISNAGAIEIMAQMRPTLTKLSFVGPVSEDVYQEVGRCEKLTSLFCTSAQERNIMPIAHGCPALKTILFGSDNDLSGEPLSLLSENCRQLTGCDVRSRDLQDSAVIKSAPHWAQLTELRLTSCALISNASVQAIARHCIRLESLDVGWCPQLSDEAACAFPVDCTLKSADFSATRITEQAVLSLARCRNLRRLDVLEILGITVNSARLAFGISPALVELYIYDLEQWSITDAGVFTIGKDDTKIPVCPLNLYNYLRLLELAKSFSEDIQFIRNLIKELKSATPIERAKGIKEIKEMIAMLHEVKHLLTPNKRLLLERRFPDEILDLESLPSS